MGGNHVQVIRMQPHFALWQMQPSLSLRHIINSGKRRTHPLPVLVTVVVRQPHVQHLQVQTLNRKLHHEPLLVFLFSPLHHIGA